MEKCVFQAMGTMIALQVKHDQGKQLLKEAKTRLQDYEKRFSANNADSMLMQVNQKAGISAVKVDRDLFDLIAFGKNYSLKADNTLNIAIGPLIKLWRIGFNNAQVPEQAEIDQVLGLLNPENILLDEAAQTVMLTQHGMEIDLGALAKGYFADQIKTFLKDHGVYQGIIDIGGNVLLIGGHPNRVDQLWRVGIQDPVKTRNQVKALIRVSDQSIVTSGIYERHLKVNGEDYHHIFDPQTGYPVENDVASVSIVADHSLTAELYTTLFYRDSGTAIIKKINQIPDIEAMVIRRDGSVLLSKGLKGRVKLF